MKEYWLSSILSRSSSIISRSSSIVYKFHLRPTYHQILVWYQIDNNNNILFLFINKFHVCKPKTAESHRIKWSYNFTCWSSPCPSTVPPACSRLSDRSEDYENGPKWFPLPKNLGLDTKIKCLAWTEAKLRWSDSSGKTLCSSTKLGFRFWRPVDTFFKDMNTCV